MGLRALGETYLGSISLKSNALGRDEIATLSLSFSVLGTLREVFNEKVWEESYRAGDRNFRLSASISLAEQGLAFRPRALAEERKLDRKAVLYWSLDPTLSGRIWVLNVNEEGRAVHPRSASEARSLIFDFHQVYQISTTELGPGRHSVSARVRVEWTKRSFTKEGRLEAGTDPVIIERA